MGLEIDLSALGNFPSDYKYKKHEIVPFGHRFVLEGNRAIAGVKLYSMRSLPNKPFSGGEMNKAFEIISEQVKDQKIDPLMGLGFAIVSDGFLNVNFWGGKYPSLINPTLYDFESMQDIDDSLARLNLEKWGPYCMWEIVELAHEGAAWRRYSASKNKTDSDKIAYLKDTFRGILV